MADMNKLIPFIFKWEGGWSNHKNDKGGATNMGVTIATWKRHGYDKNRDGVIDVKDLKLITKEDAVRILRIYWNKWKADQINNQSIANILVDWVWGSGANGIKIPQRILGVKQDGIVGPKTIEAINKYEQKTLFDKIHKAREQYFRDICRRDNTQYVFLNGWLNRLNSFKFQNN
mgnify:CR=1 FL=1